MGPLLAPAFPTPSPFSGSRGPGCPSIRTKHTLPLTVAPQLCSSRSFRNCCSQRDAGDEGPGACHLNDIVARNESGERSGELLVSSFARLDTERASRTGFPEVVWGQGKTAHQIASILAAMAESQPIAMATRIDAPMYAQVEALLAGVVYHKVARILTYSAKHASPGEDMATVAVAGDGYETPSPQTNGSCTGSAQDVDAPFLGMGLRLGEIDINPGMQKGEDTAPVSSHGQADAPDGASTTGTVAIVSAGTADLPVAEEARVTAEVMGLHVRMVSDVGVAGLHRLLNQINNIRSADVVVVVAGTDGALPSVVAGLVDAPIIAVPTSVGYGASFGGVAALLTMLNSCSPGLTVVNIDNGFGAALATGRILKLVQEKAPGISMAS